MTNSDKQKFTELLEGNANCLDHFLNKNAVPFWFDDLKDYEFNEIRSAFDKWRKSLTAEARSWPMSSDIIGIIVDARRKPKEVIEIGSSPCPPEILKEMKEKLTHIKKENRKPSDVPNDDFDFTGIVRMIAETKKIMEDDQEEKK